jgi:hypothetical protein
MWRKLALVATVLTVAASPELFAVRAAPDPKPLPDARPTAAAPTQSAEEVFAAICREGVVESRRDPAWLSQSYLGDNCQAPRTPAVIDGTTASREEIVAGMAAAKRYAAAADNFQKCVSDFVAARSADRPLTPAQVIIQNYRIQVAEKNKEVTTNQMHAAIMAFNKYGSDCPM